MKGRLARRAAVLVGAALSLGTIAIASVEAADAMTGYHVVASPSLNARSGPGTGYGVAGSLPYGATIDVSCQFQGGTSVGGDRTWDRLATGWWISDYWTNSPSFNSDIPGVPDCNATPPSIRPATVAAGKSAAIPKAA